MLSVIHQLERGRCYRNGVSVTNLFAIQTDGLLNALKGWMGGVTTEPPAFFSPAPGKRASDDIKSAERVSKIYVVILVWEVSASGLFLNWGIEGTDIPTGPSTHMCL